ncbi:MAG: transcriptional regulator, partial [Oscillospiraceae bacterium]|nr:transcriptional regulator [Oscillospiraceae bacterium]
VTVVAVCALAMFVSVVELPRIVRIALIVLAVLTATAGIGAAILLDVKAGYFECPYCKTLFVPTTGDYMKGYHTIMKRRLTCPDCGKTAMCRHRILR